MKSRPCRSLRAARQYAGSPKATDCRRVMSASKWPSWNTVGTWSKLPHLLIVRRNQVPVVPLEMPVVEIASPGGPEQLRLASRPVPTPGESEVLIRVIAAGVNRPDVMQRQGFYAPPPGASDIPGLEVAGEIVAIGAKVTGLAVRDRV